MSLTETREIVTPERAIGLPDGERVLREVAAEYGITVAHIRGRWNGHRRYGPAKITVARRLDAMGWSMSKIGRLMRRSRSGIAFYLGGHAGKTAMHTPEHCPLGPRQSRIYSTLDDRWMTSKIIARRAGLEWVVNRTSSRVSGVCHELVAKGLVEKGGMPMKPLWRRAR